MAASLLAPGFSMNWNTVSVIQRGCQICEFWLVTDSWRKPANQPEAVNVLGIAALTSKLFVA